MSVPGCAWGSAVPVLIPLLEVLGLPWGAPGTGEGGSECVCVCLCLARPGAPQSRRGTLRRSWFSQVELRGQGRECVCAWLCLATLGALQSRRAVPVRLPWRSRVSQVELRGQGEGVCLCLAVPGQGWGSAVPVLIPLLEVPGLPV